MSEEIVGHYYYCVYHDGIEGRVRIVGSPIGSWYTYLLKCGDGTYYCGITNDVERRIAMHEDGRGAKYTRGRGPLLLVMLESYDSKSAALKREVRIKRLSRAQKIAMVRQFHGLTAKEATK